MVLHRSVSEYIFLAEKEDAVSSFLSMGAGGSFLVAEESVGGLICCAHFGRNLRWNFNKPKNSRIFFRSVGRGKFRMALTFTSSGFMPCGVTRCPEFNACHAEFPLVRVDDKPVDVERGEEST